ncbi:hypothetical protein OY671_009316, partial [Metschnikowia pulcherrima]
LSRRQIERKCNISYGAPPKVLARKYRASRAAVAMRGGEEGVADAIDRGFYDQSHMIREVKHFTGLTPRQIRADPGSLSQLTILHRSASGGVGLTRAATAPICNRTELIRLDPMRLSSLADYAVIMMSAAARHCGSAAKSNATTSADETGSPSPTVQKLVSRLSAGGSIESTRGTGGGFRSSRPAAAISLAEII